MRIIRYAGINSEKVEKNSGKNWRRAIYSSVIDTCTTTGCALRQFASNNPSGM